MLAQARETIPGPGTMPGGMAAEAKWDGHRALLFTPARAGEPVLLQSRRGALVQERFPDLVAAAQQLPHGLVLDGELTVWSQGGLSFEALQRRASAGARTIRQLAAETPAHFIAFDVLQTDGQELLQSPYTQRRQILEALFADRALKPPWVLCPMTTDLAVAQEWLDSWTDVPGLEGVVLKGLRQTYRPAARGWVKVRRRNTAEALIGGITGTLSRPQLLVLGRYDTAGRLRMVGRTTPLKPDAARQLAAHLTPAGSDHPWTGVRFTASWRSSDRLEPVLVELDQVAEIQGDTAVDRGAWRHPVRYVRLRQDITVADVPVVGDGI